MENATKLEASVTWVNRSLKIYLPSNKAQDDNKVSHNETHQSRVDWKWVYRIITFIAAALPFPDPRLYIGLTVCGCSINPTSLDIKGLFCFFFLEIISKKIFQENHKQTSKRCVLGKLFFLGKSTFNMSLFYEKKNDKIVNILWTFFMMSI